jgi:polysaccharide deacetylase family protein (PEP-CTERM system associated)
MEGARPPAVQSNVLTVDVEDWFQLAHRRLAGAEVPVSRHVERDTMELLDELAAHEVTATFFIVGKVAEAFPGLVRAIASAGHEIGSHSNEHRTVDRLSASRFEADLRRSIDVIEDAAQEPVRGFRAPEFSIDRGCPWVFEILVNAGIRYDSSIVPVRSRRYGVPDAPVQPYSIETPSGPLVELPITTTTVCGKRFPTGGGYLRILPWMVACRGLKAANHLGSPAVVFIHPHDAARERLSTGLRASGMRGHLSLALWGLRRNLGRRALAERLPRLLREGRFGMRAGTLAERAGVVR